MLITALISFAILVVAWLVLPGKHAAIHPEVAEEPHQFVSDLLEATAAR